ncbi:SHOCT domain-containing protein [Candidatus Kaiserbacteria bacterium]|nr:SHOCT domain-containing protein [Candidatus Kaiserbacteria bacterium]
MYGLYDGYGGWGMMGNPLGWAVGGVMMLVFWVVFIGLIVWAVREFSGRHYRRDSRDSSALEILKERYARGEIDREEFESKKRDLA